MKLAIAALGTVFLISACAQDLRAQCSAAHPGDSAAAQHCVKVAESRILSKPGSAFAKSRRGGPG